MMKRLLPALLALGLLLSACSGGEEPSAETQPEHSFAPVEESETPQPTPYDGPVSPLSGLPMDEKWVDRRPVAVMLNNLKEALPQLGQSMADIIYEVPAEGGITRMLGVFQSLDGVGKIGSIRSARPYYLELALGHDAIFIHAGGSEDAYAKIRQWGVDALDGVRGPYMSNTEYGNLMWRDPERKQHYSLEHTVVTTGEMIQERFAGYTNLRQEHEEGWTYEMEFAEDGTPAAGESAGAVTVPFSNYKTGTFTYDPEQQLYLVEEYGEPYIDGDTGEQVGVTNLVVVQTACRNTGDSLGHITVDLSGSGEGYFACGGKIVPITWSKQAPDGQLYYYGPDGAPLTFGTGRTYVCIIPLDREVTWAP